MGNPVVIEEISASFTITFYIVTNILKITRFPSSGEDTNPETHLTKNITAALT